MSLIFQACIIQMTNLWPLKHSWLRFQSTFWHRSTIYLMRRVCFYFAFCAWLIFSFSYWTKPVSFFYCSFFHFFFIFCKLHEKLSLLFTMRFHSTKCSTWNYSWFKSEPCNDYIRRMKKKGNFFRRKVMCLWEKKKRKINRHEICEVV